MRSAPVSGALPDSGFQVPLPLLRRDTATGGLLAGVMGLVGEHLLFSFLTTEANDLVRPVHAKAMPVVLSGTAEQDEWLTASADRIASIQARVFPAEALVRVNDEEAAQYVGGYLK